MPEQPLQLSLRYIGNNVDDGTMSLDEVVTALRGFAGAYGRTASQLAPQADIQLRIAASRPGSLIVDILAVAHDPLTISITKAAGGFVAKFVFDRVKEYIEAKKAVKNKPYTIETTGSYNLVIVAQDGSNVTVHPETARLFNAKALDADLEKLVSPLSDDYVDELELTATEEDSSTTTSITSGQKQYFGSGTADGERPRAVTLEGRAVSYNKETHRGIFRLRNGSRVPYRFGGQAAAAYVANDFGYAGMLRVQGTGYFDDSMVLTRLELETSVRLQQRLPLGESETEIEAPPQ